MSDPSPFSRLPAPRPDPIFAIAKQAKAAGKNAINATIGIILDETDGQAVLFESIRQAAIVWSQTLKNGNFTYPPLVGLPDFLAAGKRLVFGEATQQSVACIATPGGTAALAVQLRLLKKLGISQVVMPVPAWANHRSLIEGAGLTVLEVPYFDEQNEPSLTFATAVLQSAAEPTALLLQAGCHNPTGRDLKEGEWTKLAALLKGSRHAVLLDLAYQGLGDGVEADRRPIEYLQTAGIPLLMAWSASKNHCIYGLRTGMAFVMVGDDAEKELIESHLTAISRQLYSMAPTPGQAIVTITQEQFQPQWRAEIDALRTLMQTKRQRLTDNLPARCQQCLQGNGMFAMLPLSEMQIRALQAENVFLTFDGRINIAGIPLSRIDEFAQKVTQVM